MDHRNTTVSKSLLELAAFADEVLHSTPAGRKALAGTKLNPGQRRLLERIDGFRSIEQILAMSGDVIGVHAALGNLIVASLVTTDAAEATAPVAVVRENVAPPAPVVPVAAVPGPAKVMAKIVAKVATREPPRDVAKGVAKVATNAPRAAARDAVVPAPKPETAPTEVETAKKLLMLEARHLLGERAAQLQPHIEACRSIAEIYDMIVKFQQHLAKTGKANPDVFLDRLTRGLQLARKQAAKPAAKGAPRPPA